MGTPASTLKYLLKRYAALGVRIDDHPLLESCCELVPSDGLNPLIAGTIPSGPESLIAEAALRAANSSSSAMGDTCGLAAGVACALAGGTAAARSRSPAESDSR